MLFGQVTGEQKDLLTRVKLVRRSRLQSDGRANQQIVILYVGNTHFFLKKTRPYSTIYPPFADLPGQILSIRVVLAVLLRLEFISVKNLSKKATAGHVRMVQNHVFPGNSKT